MTVLTRFTRGYGGLGIRGATRRIIVYTGSCISSGSRAYAFQIPVAGHHFLQLTVLLLRMIGDHVVLEFEFFTLTGKLLLNLAN